VAFSVEADSTYFLAPAAPHRNVVSSKPTTCAATSASALAHRASMPCTNPSEGPVPPHKSAISPTQRATGTCW
jgi:hypothetical protein